MEKKSVVCPECQAKLNVPGTLMSFQCPKCKQKVTLGPEKTAPKLASPKAPAAAKSDPAPAPALAKKVKVKAVVVDEDAEAQAAATAAKEKKLKASLDEIEEEELTTKQKFAVMKDHCRRIRSALNYAYWGVRLYMLGFIVALGVGVMMVFVPDMALPFMIILCICGLASMILTAIPFFMAITGLKKPRMYGFIGVAVCVLHFIIVAVESVLGLLFCMANAAVAASDDKTGIKELGQDHLEHVYKCFGAGTNLFAITDGPGRIVAGWGWIILPVFGGILEFCRGIVLALLVQVYAELGKAPETGYKAFKTINIFFWTTLLLTVARTIASLIFNNAPEDSMFRTTGNSLHGIMFIVGILVYGLSQMSLANAITDTKDFCTAERYLAKKVRDD